MSYTIHRIFYFTFGMLVFYACKNNTPNCDIEQFYNNTIRNYNTTRDSLDDFYAHVADFKTAKANNADLAKLECIKGHYHYQNVNLDSATFHYLKAVQLSKNSDPLKLNFMLNVVIAAIQSKDTVASQNMFAKTIALAKKKNIPEINVRILAINATLASRKADFKTAIALYTKADSIAEPYDFYSQRVHINYNLAKTLAKSGKTDNAFTHYLLALQIAQQHNIQHLLPDCYLGLSRLYRKVNRLDLAIENHEKFMSMVAQRGDSAKIAIAWDGMGILLAEQKQWNKSEEAFKRALEIKKSLGNASAIAVGITNLANLYERMGKRSEAIALYEEALTMRLQNNISGNSLNINMNNLAEIYISIKKYDEAKQLLNRVVDFTNTYPNLLLSSEAKLRLAEIYKNEGHYKKAMEFYSQYIEDDKQLTEQNATKHLNEVMVKHETRQKAQIIAMQQQEMHFKTQITRLLLVVFILLFAAMVLMILRQRDKLSAIRKLYSKQQELLNQEKEIIKLQKKIHHLTEKTCEEPLIAELLKLLEEQQVFTQTDISLEKLSRMLNTNTTYTSQIINSKFECNFKTLINKYRVDYCKKELLLFDDEIKPLKEIAFNAGFISPSTFYAAFKRECGITPAQFRAQYLNEQML